jgi:hypothetical protein
MKKKSLVEWLKMSSSPSATIKKKKKKKKSFADNSQTACSPPWNKPLGKKPLGHGSRFVQESCLVPQHLWMLLAFASVII